MRTHRVALTLDNGRHNPPRVGWWLVTGPQPERDAYATIELSKIYGKAHGVPPRVMYRWYLNRRTVRRLDQVASGECSTRDEAFSQVTDAWTEHIGSV